MTYKEKGVLQQNFNHLVEGLIERHIVPQDSSVYLYTCSLRTIRGAEAFSYRKSEIHIANEVSKAAYEKLEKAYYLHTQIPEGICVFNDRIVSVHYGPHKNIHRDVFNAHCTLMSVHIGSILFNSYAEKYDQDISWRTTENFLTAFGVTLKQFNIPVRK